MRSAEGVDSLASPRQQIRQANRACCYDKQTRSWLAAGQGLKSSNYRVLLNREGLLSLAIDKGFIYNHEENETEHITFDLRTGRRLTLADLLADSPAQLGRRLGAAIDHRLWDELGDVAATYGDSTLIAYVAGLYGLYEWNTPKSRAVAGGNAVAGLTQWDELADFALTPTAVLLFTTLACRG